MRKPLNITIRTITANIRSAVLRNSLAYDGRRHLPADPTCSFDIRIADIDTP